jgi:hypothetical protein
VLLLDFETDETGVTMKPVLRLFIFSIIWLLSGCAYSPVAPVAQDSRAKDFNTSPYKASVYIYRNETLYYAVPMTVSVNGKVLGTTAGHKPKFLSYPVPIAKQGGFKPGGDGIFGLAAMILSTM